MEYGTRLVTAVLLRGSAFTPIAPEVINKNNFLDQPLIRWSRVRISHLLPKFCFTFLALSPAIAVGLFAFWDQDTSSPAVGKGRGNCGNSPYTGALGEGPRFQSGH
jgi:hypothetical protein